MQIRKSRCKSASVYIAVGVSSTAGVNLGAGLGFGEPRARPEPGEPGVAVSNILVGPFPFTVAPLGAKSLSGSLETAEALWGFFQQVVILQPSGAKWRNSSEPFQIG